VRKEPQIFERLSIKINYYLLNGIHSRNMLTKKKLMKGVKKVISILVRTISITRMKLLMLPKAKKPDQDIPQCQGYHLVSGLFVRKTGSFSVMGKLLGGL
jgi:hypothetical protein